MEKTIHLQQIADLKKLEGWRINKVENGVDGVDPILLLELSHPLSENQIRLRVKSTVTFGRSGNIFVANALLTFQTEDIPKG